MIELHPQLIHRDGKPEFAVLPYQEFLALRDALDDAEDLKLIEASRAEDDGTPNIPLDTVLKEFGLK